MKKHLYFFTTLLMIALLVSGCRANKGRHCADCPHFSEAINKMIQERRG